MGLKQNAFADRLGISRAYLSQIETGREPSGALQDTILRIEKEWRTVENTDSIGDSKIPIESELSVFREEPTPYQTDEAPPPRPQSLGIEDALAQVRSDISMMEGGSLEDKRRAYHFLRDVHLPLLARCLKLN